jgi:hypothetical protein
MKKIMEPCDAVAKAVTAVRIACLCFVPIVSELFLVVVQVLSWTQLGHVRTKLDEVMGSPSLLLDPAVWSRKLKGGDSTVVDTVALAFARAKSEWKPAPAAVRKASTFVSSDVRKELAGVQDDMGRARDEARACADSDGAAWSTFAAKVLQACDAAGRAIAAANSAIQTCESELLRVGREVGVSDSTAAAGGGSTNVFLQLKAFSDMFDKAMEKARRIAARGGKANEAVSAPVATSAAKPPPAAQVAPKSIQEMLNAKFSGARGSKPVQDDSSDDNSDW